MFEDDLYAQSNSSIIAGLGKRVREYRMKAQLTQEELAAKAEILICSPSLLFLGLYSSWNVLGTFFLSFPFLHLC